MQGSKRAYRGRVVQMDAAFSVLNDAVVWIEGNRIKAVLDATATPPSGFEHMTPIDTKGTFYPGLIELHNHLGYDILKLWDVPKRYCNRGQWQGSPPYRAGVSDPMGVLGRTAGVPPADCPIYGGQMPDGRYHHIARHHSVQRPRSGPAIPGHGAQR